MNRRIFVAMLAILLVSTVLVSACSSSVGPSKADVEKFALSHPDIGPLYAGLMSICTRQSVEVIQIGKPSKYVEVTAWPARVKFTCTNGYSELWELWMFKNAYEEWDCLLSGPAG